MHRAKSSRFRRSFCRRGVILNPVVCLSLWHPRTPWRKSTFLVRLAREREGERGGGERRRREGTDRKRQVSSTSRKEGKAAASCRFARGFLRRRRPPPPPPPQLFESPLFSVGHVSPFGIAVEPRAIHRVESFDYCISPSLLFEQSTE